VAIQAPVPESKPSLLPLAKLFSQPEVPVATVAFPRTPASRQATAPDRSLDRTGLVRELQRQLKRTGCYAGEVHGSWTPSVRQAMRTLVQRANAVLPVEEPDQILLAMAESQPDLACDRPCPAGQSLAEGQCLPTAVMARASKPQPAPVFGLPATDDEPDTNQPVPAGRMGLAGPRPEAPESPAVRGTGPYGSQAAKRRTKSRTQPAWVQRVFGNTY
jgi:peptidoglycan hydrolase-like protein with peptidoglycan-binding domain